MKSSNGITLTSLIIYVIGFLIITGIVASLTSFYYGNIDIDGINDNSMVQYTKFSAIFSKEINTENNSIIDCKTYTENEQKVSYIIFSTGNQYTFKNKCIYKNKIKICTDIEDCDFSYIFLDSKYRITVNIKSYNINMTGDNAIQYTLKQV